ncbi:hypothetical protein VTO73DRAFT_5862 [Trametes versicolor]
MSHNLRLRPFSRPRELQRPLGIMQGGACDTHVDVHLLYAWLLPHMYSVNSRGDPRARPNESLAEPQCRFAPRPSSHPCSSRFGDAQSAFAQCR